MSGKYHMIDTMNCIDMINDMKTPDLKTLFLIFPIRQRDRIVDKAGLIIIYSQAMLASMPFFWHSFHFQAILCN